MEPDALADELVRAVLAHAHMLPVDSEELKDFVLAHAPELVEGMAAADAELASGQTVSLADIRDELEAGEQ